MEQLIKNLIEQLTNLIYNNSIFVSLLLGIFVIVLESIIPILPLAVFIAINTVVFGNFFGFVISWVATIVGCSISFLIFRKGFSKYLYRNIDIKKKGSELMNVITNLNFSKLVLILAVPFTPAFSINIGAGLSKMSYKKYLLALIISKLSIVYFWGFIGTTFVESITDIGVLIKLGIILLITFILSQIIIKKFKIK